MSLKAAERAHLLALADDEHMVGARTPIGLASVLFWKKTLRSAR